MRYPVRSPTVLFRPAPKAKPAKKRRVKKSSNPKRNPEWAKVRACHLLAYPECRACGTTENVVVHHIRYRGQRGEGELPGDLVTLCRTHHDAYHHEFGLRGLIVNTLAYCERIRRANGS